MLGARLVLTGDVDWERIVELYVAADVFALLSEREPWAVVVNEAAACGLPLVLSDRVGAAHDLLRDGENGVLVPAGDVDAASGALRALAADPGCAAAQGARSRELARDWGYGPSVDGFLAAVREAVARLRGQPVPHGARARILVLNQYYWPGVEATAHLLTELCEALAEEYDVEVVTGVLHGHEDEPRQIEHNGVRIVRVSVDLVRALGARPASRELLLLPRLRAPPRSRGPAPDLVLCMTDPPIIGDLGVAVGRRFGAPVLVISQDVFPEIATELDRLRNPAVIGVLGGLVGGYLRRADRIVAIGETMRERLEAKGAPPERLRVIPNWVDTSAITPQPRDNTWAEQHDLVSRFVVMHSGNVGHAQDLDSLVRAATFLRDRDDVRIVIAGFGARHAQIIALADRLEVDETVRFLPYQKRERLPLSLSSADVHVVGLAKGLAGYVVPSRLYGILAAGRPVIAPPRTRARPRGSCARSAAASSSPRPARAARADDPRGRRRRVRPRRDGTPRTSATSRRRRIASSRWSGIAPSSARCSQRDREGVFWGSLGALAWTHAGYPVAMGVLARLRPRPVRRADATPSVALVVSAHDEEAVIRRRVENLLALDYPTDELEIVVASDGSTDLTDGIVDEIAAREPRCVSCTARARGRSRRSIAPSGRPRATCSRSRTRTPSGGRTRCACSCATSPTRRSATSAGSSGSRPRTAPTSRASTGATRCGCASRSRASSSITAGNGAIYAVRREAYVEDDPKFGHDFGFPYLMEQAGLRAVYDPDAVAVEKPATEPEDEYGRKVRTIARSWGHIAHRADVPADAAALHGRARLAPRAPLLERACSTSACCVSNLALRGPCALLPPRARAPARRPRAGAAGKARLPDPGSAARLLLLRRHEGHARGARPLPPFRHPADVGQGEGDEMNRVVDVAVAGDRARPHEPARRASLRSRRSSRTAGRSSTARRASASDGEDFERAQAPHDGRRRRGLGAGFAVDQGDPRITRRRAHPPADVDRRAPAALERAARGHERRRARGRRSATRSSSTTTGSGGASRSGPG